MKYSIVTAILVCLTSCLDAQTFVDATTKSKLTGMAGGSAAWIDFNQDGYEDLNVSNQIWINNRNGTFTQLANTGLAGAAVWADINNDGYPDAMCWAGKGYLFLNQKGTSLTNISDKLPDLPTKVSLAASMGDFNGDGLVDLYVGGYEGPGYLTDVMYFNTAENNFKEVWRTKGTTMPSRGITTADYDEDGDLDLVTKGRLYENRSLRKNFVQVKLVGTGLIDGMAVGSQVRSSLEDHVQTRQVCSSTGQGNQNSPILHFSLGDYKGPLKAEIAWLGGKRTVKTLELNRLNTIRPE